MSKQYCGVPAFQYVIFSQIKYNQIMIGMIKSLFKTDYFYVSFK